jgi:hypothetical protein
VDCANVCADCAVSLLAGAAALLTAGAAVLMVLGLDVLLRGADAAGATECPVAIASHPVRTASPAAKATTGKRFKRSIALTVSYLREFLVIG